MGPDPQPEVVVAPYGAWRSPIRIEDVVGDVIQLAEPWIDGDDIFWVEGRPAEGGRRILVRAAADGSTSELTPAPFNVRSRVHEYGGGSYVVVGGIVVFSDFADGRLYRLDPGAEAAVPITPAGPWRYADLRPDLARRRFYAVREDHSLDGEATNTIVTIPLDGGDPQVLVKGPDFVSSPRLVARRHAARLARVGPSGHALGRDPPAGRGVRARWDARRGDPGRRRPRRIDRPARMGARWHAPPDQRPDGLVEPLPPGRRATVGAARHDGGRVRRPALDVRPVELRVPARWQRRGRGPLGRARSPLPDRARCPHRRGGDAVHRARVAARRCPRGRRPGRPGGRPVRHRALRPGDPGPGRRPAPGDDGHLRPGDHRRARVDRVPDDRRPDRACALLPADQPGVPRPRRREAAAHRAVARRSDIERLDVPRPREAVPDQPRHRDRRRRLRREHRLRARIPPAPRWAVGRRRRRRLRRRSAVPRRARRRRSGPAGHRGRQRRRLHDARGPCLP